MKDERVPLRTILQNFINHVEDLEARLKESDDLYEAEFQELKNISDALKTQKHYACTEGEKPVNRRKNRYKDILPFDISRVVLSEFPGVPGSDYINANYIRGASGSPAYIASQGPLPHTVVDFWRLAVECEVQVIIMACNECESGKHKCESYVPESEGEERQYGDVTVLLSQSRQVCPDFTVRKLQVRYTGPAATREERMVCQFHYSAWPDHGVPSSVLPLLRMIRMVRDTQASETLPVLVHCSAGCGRTGTVCAIDYVWGLLKAGKLTPAFNLFDLVADMRRQRIAMVQTKDQYMLVHRAVRQLFSDQLRMIESHPYANVDSAGKPLVGPAHGDHPDDDYEEICLAEDASPRASKRPAPSPPPQIKPPPRKNAPRNRSRPPPLPRKRRAPQPGDPGAAEVPDSTLGMAEAAAPVVGGSLDRHRPALEPPQLPAHQSTYQGSLDRAEAGRRHSVDRLREVFESSGGDSQHVGSRLSRSKSSASIRPHTLAPAPMSVGRPRTGGDKDGPGKQLVLYHPPVLPRPYDPPNYAEISDLHPAPASLRAPDGSPPLPGKLTSRAETIPVLGARTSSAGRVVAPPHRVERGSERRSASVATERRAPPPPAPERSRPPAVERRIPVERQGTSAERRPAVTDRRAPAGVIQRTSPPAAVGNHSSERKSDRRPILPIKRSKSLKITMPAMRTPKLGPAYLALENAPRGGPLKLWDDSGWRPRTSETHHTSNGALAPSGDHQATTASPRPPPMTTHRVELPVVPSHRKDHPAAPAQGVSVTVACNTPPPKPPLHLGVMVSVNAASGASRLQKPSISAVVPAAVASTTAPLSAAAPSPPSVRPLYVNVTTAALASPDRADSSPGHVNIDLLREYEEQLVQRSRELGLNDTIIDDLPSPRHVSPPRQPVPTVCGDRHSWAAPALLSPGLVTSLSSAGGTCANSLEPHYANVSPPLVPVSVVAQQRSNISLGEDTRSGHSGYATRNTPLLSNYPNCTPEARTNLQRIESNLLRNQRSAIYDITGRGADLAWKGEDRRNATAENNGRMVDMHGRAPLAAAEESSPPPPASRSCVAGAPLGWRARERRNSFRQAVRAGEHGHVPNYEPIWGGDKVREPRELTACATAEPGGGERPSGPPATIRLSTGAPRTRPAVVPASSYIVQGDMATAAPDCTAVGVRDRARSPPRQFGNSLFWTEGTCGEPVQRDPSTAVTMPNVGANSVFYSGTPSPPGRCTSLNVSENSAFKPYSPEKSSPNYAAVYRANAVGDSPRSSSLASLTAGSPAGRSEDTHSADSAASVPPPATTGPVAPPRKRSQLRTRRSASQPLLVGPSHLFLADIELDCQAGRRDSDCESLPPAVPEKTQAAYQIPTPVREVLPRRRSNSPEPHSESSALSRSLSLRPGARLEAGEARPLNRALGRLQATASSLRSRLAGGRVEAAVDDRRRPPINPHSRQAYI